VISVENRKISLPVYFAHPLKVYPWNWVLALGSKTRMMGLPGRERSLMISSAVWIQYTNATDGQTDIERHERDGRTDDSKDRIYA